MADDKRPQSIFGSYAGSMQVMIDSSLSLFAPLWYPKYFDFGIQTATLDFKTVIGRHRIEAAASIVDRNSPSPLRSRGDIEKLSGEVPAIKQAFNMKESDLRNFMIIQDMRNVSDQVKKNQLLDLMFGDIQKCGNAVHKRLDILCLQAISTGKVDVSITNNPDGLVLGEIDLLMPAGNFKTVSGGVWSNSATATPITDIHTIVEAEGDNGREFAKMLMTRATFWKLQKAEETLKMLAGHFKLATNQKKIGTLDEINEFLEANQLPIIEIVNEKIGIEKDGVITTLSPFKATSVTFIPAGKLGIIHNAYSIEELKPVEGVSYATYNRALISKWSTKRPWGEMTEGEFNAFPGVEAIDGICILDVETAA